MQKTQQGGGGKTGMGAKKNSNVSHFPRTKGFFDVLTNGSGGVEMAGGFG